MGRIASGAVREGMRRELYAAGGPVVRGLWEMAGRVGSIGPRSGAGRRFGAFGRGSIICFPQGAIFNERYVRIGEDTLIGPNVSLSAGMVPGQVCPSDPVVAIGSRCLIGRGSSIVGHLGIDIGDDVWTGPNVYITDQNHGYLDVEVPISRQTQPERAVSIGAGSWLGTGTVVLPGRADRAPRHRRCRFRRARRPPRLLRGRRRPGTGDQPVRRSGVGRSAGTDAVARGLDRAAQPLPSSPGGAQRSMPFALVKSVTTLDTGPPATSLSRYGVSCRSRNSAVYVRRSARTTP